MHVLIPQLHDHLRNLDEIQTGDVYAMNDSRWDDGDAKDLVNRHSNCHTSIAQAKKKGLQLQKNISKNWTSIERRQSSTRSSARERRNHARGLQGKSRGGESTFDTTRYTTRLARKLTSLAEAQTAMSTAKDSRSREDMIAEEAKVSELADPFAQTEGKVRESEEWLERESMNRRGMWQQHAEMCAALTTLYKTDKVPY